MRKVIYTCLVNDYEPLREQPIYDGWEYIAYTDRIYKSNTWQCKPVRYQHIDPTVTSRYHKIKSPPKADVTVYIDARMTLTRNPDEWIKKGLGLRKHPERNCVYKEADEVLKLRLDTPDNVRNIMRLYTYFNYPQNAGLYENGTIARFGDFGELNTLWWDMYLNGSKRDQLSLMYCLYRLNIQPYTINNVIKKHGRSKPRQTV